MSRHYNWDGPDLLLRVRISPRASRDKVGDLYGDRLKLLITAPPVDGKANAHLVQFVAKQFGVSKSSVSLVSGETSRDKTIRIEVPRKLPKQFLVEPD
ncbi:MAG: DUF167 family protein [Fuerstiella sp.]